uniref:Methyltransferase type 11 domain-containing protein n=1 Tax=Aureoumbra lagunensis TaxID=44058 RepID=A0A7S3NKV3_9STRA
MVQGKTLRDICVNKSFETTLEDIEWIEPHGGPLKNGDQIIQLIQGKSALEIGGPTYNGINLYDWLASCDIVAQFIDERIGRNGLDDPFYVGSRQMGKYIIADAANLTNIIPDHSYDVIYASHVLEHMQNPLGALLSWDQILKPGGLAFFILPWKQNTFDQFRAVNTLEQLGQKYIRSMAGDPGALRTDFEQTIRSMDMTRDYGFPPGSSNDALRERTLGSPRGLEQLHWHVYDLHLLNELFKCLNYSVVSMDILLPFHQVIAGIKPLS